MQSTEDRVILWEQWMNSRNTLRKKELDEMKDHLLEEIEYLMTPENLSEEEAFHKAVDTIGKKKELIEEEIKVKQEKHKTEVEDRYQLHGIPVYCWLIFFHDSIHTPEKKPGSQ